jgi:predicted membrane channel-forming protein YqfA (hemolysin III family)
MAVSWFDHFRTPEWRPYRALMFVGLGLSGVVPILHGLSKHGFHALNERIGLVWVMLEGAMYIFGAFLYAVSDTISPSRPLSLANFVRRLDSPRGCPRVLSISGAVHTRYFTCSWYWRPRRICMAWRRRLISIIACLAPNARGRMVGTYRE